MGDFVKIAVKTALVATIVGSVIAIFNNVSVSLPTLTKFVTVISKAKFILFFYCPWISDYFSLIMILCQISIAIWIFYFSGLAVRWILKVNE